MQTLREWKRDWRSIVALLGLALAWGLATVFLG